VSDANPAVPPVLPGDAAPYDAFLLISFGGPEGPEDVMPFLENVLRGRNVPRERMLEVAEHYHHFGGKSPINDQNRELLAAIKELFAVEGPNLPIYWGNRNWHPMLSDTLRQMKQDGVKHALGFVTSAFSSYSGCRQYRENVKAAQAEVGEGAPAIDKLRVYFNHPGFVEPMAENLMAALAEVPGAAVAFTAHSIPSSMSDTSSYVRQLEEACRIVAELAGVTDWRLVYQSRSGPPNQPWLEPDIGDHIRSLHGAGVRQVVIAPIGFISDHMEVLYDLDTEAAELCQELGMEMRRVKTVGVHPKFVRLVRDLVLERMDPEYPKLALGSLGPWHDVCPDGCCPAPQRPAVRPGPQA
jgi:protoporphyrin/coproporphyrin ferrochelatase